MVNKDYRKNILLNAPFAYSYHKVILDEKNNAIDYVFIEVNKAFEEMTGLKFKKIKNKKITEILPDIRKGEFDWIEFYGNVAMNQTEESFEQYSLPLNRWYKGHAFSTEKGFFIVTFTDITTEYKMAHFTKELNNYTYDNIDYEKITNNIKELSGADYAIFNIFDENGRDFFTKSISGIGDNISKLTNIIGFNLENKKWSYDPVREEKIKNNKTIIFEKLSDLTHSTISKNIIKILEKTFFLGEIAIVKITKDDKMSGDFTLIFKKNNQLKNKMLVETYADSIGLVIDRINIEKKIIEKDERLSKAQDFTKTGSWEYDIITKKLLWSKECEHLFGLNSGEFEGTFEAFIELIHPEDRDYVIRTNSPIVNGEEGIPLEYEHRIITKQGEIKWVRESAGVLKNNYGDPIKVIGFIMDITKEKEKTEQLENFFNVNLDLLCIANTEGYFVKVNKEWENILGYSSKELEKRKFLDFVHPDDINETLEAIKDLKDERDVLNFINRYKSKDGNYKYIEWRSKSKNNIIYAAARDITEHIELEKSIKESKNRLDVILSTIPDLLFVLDNNGNYKQVYTNDKSLLTLSESEISNINIIDIINKNDYEKYLLAYNQLKQTNKPQIFEYELIIDNNKYYFEAKLNKLNENEIIALCRNITSRKKDEQKIIENEKRFRSLFEQTHDAVFILDLEGNHIDANKRACEMLGYTKEEITRISFSHTSTEINQSEKILKKLLKNEIIKPYERKIKRKDGSEIYVEINVELVKDSQDKPLHIQSTLRDVTERIEQEKALRKQYQIFELISNISSDFIKTNMENIDNYLFESLEKVMCFIKSDKASISEFTEDRKGYKVIYEKSFNKNNDNLEFEINNISWFIDILKKENFYINDLQLLPLEIKEEKNNIIDFTNNNISILCFPYFKYGEILGFITYEFYSEMKINYEDIYSLQLLSEVITNAYIKKLTQQELIEAKIEADKANKSKSIFLSKITHDLKTPLNAVSGFAELLKDDISVESKNEYLNFILQSSNNMFHLINDLLDLSKLETNNLVLNKNEFNLNDELNNLIESINIIFNQKGNKVFVNIDKNIPNKIIGDQYRLNRIIQNLFTNSNKFTKNGEIKIHIILINESDTDYTIKFVISDTGKGIEENEIDKLFEPYYQAHEYKGVGTGLGLSLCKELVELMNGKIHIESELGKGTKVIFTADFNKIMNN